MTGPRQQTRSGSAVALAEHMDPARFPLTTQKGLTPQQQMIDAVNYDDMKEARDSGKPRTPANTARWAEFQEKHIHRAEVAAEVNARTASVRCPSRTILSDVNDGVHRPRTHHGNILTTGTETEKREEVSRANLPAYWPAGAQASAYLERVQKLLDTRGLTGTERRFQALMRKVADAFRAQDLAGVTSACDALVDAIEGAADQPTPQEPAPMKVKGEK